MYLQDNLIDNEPYIFITSDQKIDINEFYGEKAHKKYGSIVNEWYLNSIFNETPSYRPCFSETLYNYICNYLSSIYSYIVSL